MGAVLGSVTWLTHTGGAVGEEYFLKCCWHFPSRMACLQRLNSHTIQSSDKY